MLNPCRPGTCKWIVCQAAIDGKMSEATRLELEKHHKGGGKRLSEYIADLRSENRLDIRVEGDHVVHRGRLPAER